MSTPKPDKVKGGPQDPDPESVGLPVRFMLMTFDQVAMQLSLSETYLASTGMVYYFGRSTGTPKPDQLKAYNIAPPTKKPEWRISEAEVIRYCKRRGIKIHLRGWVT
ncbi:MULTISPECIES: hypothetical protein [Streptomyces]|uniref:hypothetical protein n=1 Tax=Streptomyces TaxID=1883 RepID=UPI003667D9DE